ncbi:MAG: hypothetical protein QM659_12985 [Rhodomicrobium sp.]
MQHADDLNEAGFDRAIENHMHRIADRRLAGFGSAVVNVEAANSGKQLVSIGGRNAVGFGGDAPHRGGEQRAITRAITDAGLPTVALRS